MAKGILGSKEVRWKWVVGNGGGAQGEGHDGMRGEVRGEGHDGMRGEVRGEGAWLRNTEDGETRMGDWWTGGRWSDVEGGRDLAKGILGSKEVRWKWVVWNGVGAQGEGHDGMRGEIRGEGA